MREIPVGGLGIAIWLDCLWNRGTLSPIPPGICKAWEGATSSGGEEMGRPGSLAPPDAEASFLFRLSLVGLRPRGARFCFTEKHG